MNSHNSANPGGSDAYAEVMDNRFRLASQPDVITNRVDASISMVAGKAQTDPATAPLPYDDAFVFLVRLEQCTPYQLWIDGKFTLSGALPSGSSSIFDLRTRPYASGVQQFRHMHFYMSKSFLQTTADEAGEPTPPEIVLPRTFAFDDPAMFFLAKGLMPAFQQRQFATPLYVDHLMNASASHLISTYAATTPRRVTRLPGMSAEQLHCAMEIMDAHIKGNLTLSELAHGCGLRPNEFKLLFKRQVGVSAPEWLACRRTEKAVTLLRETKKSLDEVAALAGYSSSAHMTAAFMSKLGNPPQIFQKENATYLFLRH